MQLYCRPRIRSINEPTNADAAALNCGHPTLGHLDFLGRLPVPLRRPFKAGLDCLVEREALNRRALECCFLAGGEWYRPFDTLAQTTSAEQAPRLIVTTLQEDIFLRRQLDFYRPKSQRSLGSAPHPAFMSAGLLDASGTFQTLAAVPFVFLVDLQRLKGRPVPNSWEDLLAPHWSREIVFGGWRPNDSAAYTDFNSYLLLSILNDFGATGVAAFAANVSHLQHNVRTTTLFGSNSPLSSTIAILPWLHAEMCPRRDTTRVVWPRDGALAMPIGYLYQQAHAHRVAPLTEYLTGTQLASLFNRNCYPSVRADAPKHVPPNASFKWLGWQYIYNGTLAIDTRRASQLFFSACQAAEMRACA